MDSLQAGKNLGDEELGNIKGVVPRDAAIFLPELALGRHKKAQSGC